MIIEAIKGAIEKYSNKLKKITRKINLRRIKLFGSVELDFSIPGLPENITLTQLLEYLIQVSNTPVVLIIDEAQHALTSRDGLNAMFAIKSARDQINKLNQSPWLMLVFTGSNRDNLAQLVIKKDQPFFGSDITTFPLLGRDYTDFFTKQVNRGLKADNQFSPDSICEAFQLVGHRPEILRQLVGQIAINNEAASLSALLKHDVSIWHGQIWQEYENDFTMLSPLQQVVLTLLIKLGRTWSPFSEESIKFYQEKLAQSVKTSSVQTAIQALRDKGFIWQSARGGYALEDEGFAEWFRHTHV